MTRRVEVPQGLQDSVVEKLQWGRRELNQHFSVDLPLPRVEYSVDSMAAGYAVESEWLIELNGRLLVENTAAFIDEIPLHELAHLYADRVLISKQPPQPRRKVHCDDWQYVMGVLGQAPRVYHTFDVSRYRKEYHTYICENCWTICNLGHIKHKRLQRDGAAYKCTSCPDKLGPLLYFPIK
jgi:SprT protein